MQEKILLVEDSLEYQAMIDKTLGFKFKVDAVATIEEARKKLRESSYALVILDIVLPDGSGYDLCREFHAQMAGAETPVIFLTGRDSLADKMMGLSLGADDYLTKPFEPQELLARVDLRIIKAKKMKYLSENLIRGPFRLDIPSMVLYLKTTDGNEIRVDATPIEFKLVLKLAQHSDQVLSRQQLIDAVWGNSVFIEDRSIDKHISAIRKKLSPFGDWIRTVSGVGYEFRH